MEIKILRNESQVLEDRKSERDRHKEGGNRKVTKATLIISFDRRKEKAMGTR